MKLHHPAVSERHEAAARRAGLVAAEAPLAAHPHILERVLQFRPVHLLPGAHHPGPEVSNPVHARTDHMGLLFSAVLPAGGQLLGRTFEDNVSSGSLTNAASIPYKGNTLINCKDLKLLHYSPWFMV